MKVTFEHKKYDRSLSNESKSFLPEKDKISMVLGGNKYLKDAKKEMFFSELYSLFSSGIDFNRAFKLLIHGEKDTKQRILFEELHESVIQGNAFWQALSHSKSFTMLDCGVVRIGEETGKLYESLLFLSDYYHKKAVQRRMVSSAVSYPIIILSVAIIVLVFMMLVIIPMFEQVYSRMGGELPAITQSVIAFSRNFKVYALVLGLNIIGFTAIIILFKHTDSFRRIGSFFLSKIPLAGELTKKHYQSHFCKLMYLLYSSGVPLLQGVEMLKGIITFYPYQQSFGTICDGLNKGESFAENMERLNGIYDRKLTTLLRVGEETNRLSDMLRKQGDNLSSELEHKLKQLGNILEPVLILLVGILVAIILISMYLPMFKLGTTIY